jgi:1,4-dihydroxy-2-naphthoyl-CoA hydrolase
MSIWFGAPALEDIARMMPDTLMSHMEITISAIGEDSLTAMMPVSSKTVQPFRVLHGGASAALAETVGSVASLLTLDPAKQTSAGLALNINHLRAAPEGRVVTATARPAHLGRSTQVWSIQIVDDSGKSIANATLTMAVLMRSER